MHKDNYNYNADIYSVIYSCKNLQSPLVRLLVNIDTEQKSKFCCTHGKHVWHGGMPYSLITIVLYANLIT
jgi:hypothetical protein